MSLKWYSDWNCQDPVSVLVQCFQFPLVQRRMCNLLMKARTLSSKLWCSTFVYVNLCFQRAAVGLWNHSHFTRFDDGAGHRFFWRLSNKFSDQLPDHIQQVKRCCNLGRSLQFLVLTGNGGCALRISSVKQVGESVPSFSCCLGGVHNLASDTCCKSLHCKVDVFVELGKPFQLPIDILAELRQ